MKINSKEDLISYFQSGVKKELLIGVENEKFLFDKATESRADYTQIVKVLKYLKKFGWKEIKESNNLIGLFSEGKSITLEPGNQIELAGDKYKNIHGVCGESFTFQDQLNQACRELNLKTVSIGYDPQTKLENVPNNPKKRYAIMTEEMPKKGKLSLDMMYQTCGTQINLDYLSENDFIKKFKLISYLTPLTIGIFANSAMKESKPSGYLSYRSRVWQNTSRGGLPEIFLENMNFEKYADFAINYPLLFLHKSNEYFPPEGKTFKYLLNQGKANIHNFELHLSTIFTELRLKKYIELRSLDACEWDCHCAGPAFFTGLLYGNLDQALDVIKKWNKIQILNAYKESYTKGLKTEIDGKTISHWSEIFLKISKKGLEKRNFLNKNGNNEEVYLKNIDYILKNKQTKAEEVLKNYN